MEEADDLYRPALDLELSSCSFVSGSGCIISVFNLP
jgi:hypothetical protein